MEPNIQFFFENEYYELSSIREAFKSDNETLSYLVQQNYFRYDPGGQGQFHFVGLIHYRNQIVFVLPKYLKYVESLSNDRKGKEALQICRVLRKFGQTYRLLPDLFNIALLPDNYSEIALADFLIRDYVDNGFYVKEKREYELNSDGEIDWPQTIDSYHPIFSRRQPIYNNLLSSSLIIDDLNIITELHKWAIKESIVNYGKWLGFEVAVHFDTIGSTKELGSAKLLLNLLNRELQISYTDRNIRLLKALIALIEKNYLSENAGVAVYGTGYFHVLWEKVCAYTFNNKIDRWTQYIPNPQWFDIHGNSFGTDSLKPDIISYKEPSEGDHLFILDAKYYNLQFSYKTGLAVSNSPGVADITKQFLYEACFEGISQKKHNCFLFPRVQITAVEIVGYVTFKLFPGKKIWNLYLSPHHFFDAFLCNQRLGEENLSFISRLINHLEEQVPEGG